MNWAAILLAIAMVESGGRSDAPAGDGGKSRGVYQIQEGYWKDGWAFSTEYQPDNKELSEDTIKGYMHRYAKDSANRFDKGTATMKDAEIVSRIHNGGPKGARRKATKGYWKKVKGELVCN
jgi:hypothetical protein